jgi:hypothetical protein
MGMTAAIVALGTGVVGTVMSAQAAAQQASAQKAQLRYQEQVARNNALALEYERDYVREKAGEDARKQRRLTAQAIGKQRAAMGSSGVVVDEGTFLDLTWTPQSKVSWTNWPSCATPILRHGGTPWASTTT